ncbi:hypothetical protein L210DRAFT_3507426 [Boletus edulis BED1]|uniref:Uncharacterized protein n=1 Tax=Boletus edulis BED1 TaxID=1328754 RepID=A0AAD4BJT0_BOLED|nr:hypothetical protein L210DRAFT_3507426 [Boletus edulis BED1]
MPAAYAGLYRSLMPSPIKTRRKNLWRYKSPSPKEARDLPLSDSSQERTCGKFMSHINVEVQKSKPQKDLGKSKTATKTQTNTQSSDKDKMRDEAEDHKSDYETVAIDRNLQEEHKGPSTSTAKVAKKNQEKKNKPNIRIPKKTDIQMMFEVFHNDFADMTLGYGLMSVLDDSDNGCGPRPLSYTA